MSILATQEPELKNTETEWKNVKERIFSSLGSKEREGLKKLIDKIPTLVEAKISIKIKGLIKQEKTFAVLGAHQRPVFKRMIDEIPEGKPCQVVLFWNNRS